MRFFVALTVLLGVIAWGCASSDTPASAPATEEPAAASEPSETPPAEAIPDPAEQPDEAAPAGDESTAAKTGEAVGGALHTAGKATEKGVKTGVGAVVKGAKAVGKASEDAAKGVASGVKGEK